MKWWHLVLILLGLGLVIWFVFDNWVSQKNINASAKRARDAKAEKSLLNAESNEPISNHETEAQPYSGSEDASEQAEKEAKQIS